MRINQIIGLKLVTFLLMLFPFTVSVGIVCAETQYVSDKLVITLREGEGNQFKIIQMLEAGTPLEIIEESERYLKVRTRRGSEGWVLKQYITRETPKSEIIAALTNKIDRLNTEIEQYEKNKESLREELKTAEFDYNAKKRELDQNLSAIKGHAEQTESELKRITRKYNALSKGSRNVAKLMKDRDGLLESNSSLQNRTEQLEVENSKLKRYQMIWWFVAGGGVFFVGWIVGKISRQKRFY